MERPLLTVLTAVIVYGDNKRKCQLPCPAISAHDHSVTRLSVMLACYLDSGETRIIKIRIAKKNTENLKNRNVLYTHKFLALRYHDTHTE